MILFPFNEFIEPKIVKETDLIVDIIRHVAVT